MSKGRASLAEIMGAKGAAKAKSGISLSDLPELLGEAMPDLPKDAVGRYRLLRSLKARFGPNFRALPGVSGVLSEFDSVIETERKIAKIRGIKMPQRGGK